MHRPIDLSFFQQPTRALGLARGCVLPLLLRWFRHRLLDIIQGNFELINVHGLGVLPVIKARISLQVKMVVAHFMERGRLTSDWAN